MKLVKKIFLGFWTLTVIFMIYFSVNDQNMNPIIWPLIILYSAFPYWLILKPKKKKKSDVDNTPQQATEPEPTSPQYVEVGNIIYRTDGKSITDAEVPYLMQLGYEKALTREQQTKPVRTKHEQQLAFNFDMNHFDKYSELEFKLIDLENDARHTTNLTKKIQLLEKTIVAYEKLKKFCYSKGKGGTIFFQDEWETKTFLSDIQKELKETKYQKDILIPEILNAIKENDGILQRNIYVLFPETSKSKIQAIIKELEANGTITKTKKGNSYELHLNGN